MGRSDGGPGTSSNALRYVVGARPLCSAATLTLTRVAAVVLIGACASPVMAQRWTIEPGVSSQLTWTSNSLLGTGSAQDDTVFELRPRVTIRGEGARLQVAGSVALNGITYLGHTQASRALPQADLTARLEAIERWLYVEAGLRAAQTSSDPFGVRLEGASTSNKVTTTQARFSPSVEAAIGPLMRYRIRSDNTWSKDSAVDDATAVPTGASGYFARHAASIEHDPRPLGWRVEAERSDTRYNDGVTDSLVTDIARLVVDYSATEDFSIGLRGGLERNNYVTSGQRNTIYGGQARWQPSPRTLLNAEGERRFFGSGWRFGFDHRTPQFAISLALARAVQSTPQSVFEIPATGNVEALLLAMFTTRYPDPAERSRVVQKFIADQGLPNATLGATNIYSQRLSLVNSRTGNLGWIGVRNSLVLSGFYVRTEDVPDSSLLATGLAANNSLQYGAGLTFSHRLAMAASLSATIDWSRIRALDSLAPDLTTQRGARVQVNLQASPKTGAVFGGRYRKLDSTLAVPGHEAAVYVGLDHRF
jgi:uncharacterized protein (PEP-CTERM system associated)